MSDNPGSLFVGEAARAGPQKLERLHHKCTSALFALTSYGSPVLGVIYLRRMNASEAASSEPRRAEHS